jgi:hypothetical protein
MISIPVGLRKKNQGCGIIILNWEQSTILLEKVVSSKQKYLRPYLHLSKLKAREITTEHIGCASDGISSFYSFTFLSSAYDCYFMETFGIGSLACPSGMCLVASLAAPTRQPSHHERSVVLRSPYLGHTFPRLLMNSEPRLTSHSAEFPTIDNHGHGQPRAHSHFMRG